MSVSHDDLEASLDKIRAKVKNPAAGLFGPGSMVWRVNREMILGLGGGRALLLQTAHPFVAHAVGQHSKFRTDPHGRGRRTFQAVFAWVFGDLDQAFRAARRVHAIHERITGKIEGRVGPFEDGTPYAANTEDALFWVHATLWDTPVILYEMVVGPLTREEKNRYYDETKLFAQLFGISDEKVPPNWEEFLEYCETMHASDLLTVDQVSLDIAESVLSPLAPNQEGLMKWYRILTAGLLPERIRHQYRFAYGRYERWVFENSIRALRAGWPRLPTLVREAPVYRAALRRLGQGSKETKMERALARLVQAPLQG